VATDDGRLFYIKIKIKNVKNFNKLKKQKLFSKKGGKIT
jgi:hypothetical protein